MRHIVIAAVVVAAVVGVEYVLWRRAEAQRPESPSDRLRQVNRKLAEGTELS
jgi:hypothetical protein